MSSTLRTARLSKSLLKTQARSFSATAAANVHGFYISPISLFGEGAVEEAMNVIKKKGFKKPLIITDPGIVKVGLADTVGSLLKDRGIASTLFGGAQPNPSIENVSDGLQMLKDNNCDSVISIGGGSSHDCAKAVALVAANGGKIQDYEGVDVSDKAQVPLISINTTAGTASEITRFTIITDTPRKVKMAIVDSNVTPTIAVNDPATMMGMPKVLTAATGMDALTHAIEAYVSTGANPITDACALKAIDLIIENLETAVVNGQDKTARTNMAYAEYLAGMAFNNASLGYVHAMAHQLGGFYNLPHGVCNAILLPHVQKFNSKAVAARLGDVAKHLKESEHTAEAAIAAIERLSKTVGIPDGLRGLGVKEADFEILAENAMKDACGFTNPIQPTKAEVIELFKQAM